MVDIFCVFIFVRGFVFFLKLFFVGKGVFFFDLYFFIVEFVVFFQQKFGILFGDGGFVVLKGFNIFGI